MGVVLEGLELFSSDPLFINLKRTPADQLGDHQLGEEMSLSQVVEVLIERWDELGDVVKAEIVGLLRQESDISPNPYI